MLALQLALHMGLRIHEIYPIDAATARVALKDGTLDVVGKGGRRRRVPLDPDVEGLLRNRLNATPTGGKLLVANDQLTHNAVKGLQQFIADNRGAAREKTIHGLRHNAACNWYQELRGQGKSHNDARRQISLWLGHTRLEIVDVYLSGLSNEELR